MLVGIYVRNIMFVYLVLYKYVVARLLCCSIPLFLSEVLLFASACGSDVWVGSATFQGRCNTSTEAGCCELDGGSGRDTILSITCI